MSKDKLKEKKKLEAEIERSLSVVKMKEIHKQIEDIEKLRKQAAIRSICKRISHCIKLSEQLINAIRKLEKRNIKLDGEIKKGGFGDKLLNSVITMYESICFDFQKTINIKKEDLDRLFPKIEFNFTTYESIPFNLSILNVRLADMKNYCLRLL